MEQNETQPKAVNVDDKNPFFKFFIGVVLSCIVYFFVRNDPLGFFVELKNYVLLIFLPLIVLLLFLKDKTNAHLKALYQLIQKFNTLFFEKIKLVFVGFVMGFIILSIVLYGVPLAKRQHLQRVQQMHQGQQMRKNSTMEGK